MGWVGGAECFPSYGPLGSNLEAFGLPGFLAGAVTPVPVWLVSCFTGVVCIYYIGLTRGRLLSHGGCLAGGSLACSLVTTHLAVSQLSVA